MIKELDPKLVKLSGWLSLGIAVYAAYAFVDTFGWIIPQAIHPVHRFDYPSGERNHQWAVPCALSIILGTVSRRTICGKVGTGLSLLVVAGIMLMVYWRAQFFDNW